MTETSPRPWRTGTSPGTDGRTIYSPVPGYPRDKLIGTMDTAEDAELGVTAVNAYGVPGPGHHVLVTVDPARNGGSASISHRMVPLHAPIGNLLAGDTEDTIQEEYDLTEGGVRLVAALTKEIRRFLAERDEDVCRAETVTVDGQQETVVVRGPEPMTEQDRKVLAEVVAAARRRVEATDPHLGVRQELALAWMGIASRVPNGPEKDRLRAAIGAVKALLGPRTDGVGGENVDVPRA